MKLNIWTPNKKELKEDDVLKYVIRKNSVLFSCSPVDSQEKFKNAATRLINDLLLELSKGCAVFYAAYRLPKECVTEIFDSTVILEQAEVLSDSFHTFYHLSEAKVNVANMDLVVESTLYFFEKDVKWTDFLASAEIKDNELRKLLKSGKLCAYFQTSDMNANDYILECGRVYEKRLRRFFEDMTNAGYAVSEDRI